MSGACTPKVIAANVDAPASLAVISNVYLVNDAKVIQCNIRDIRARKRVEAELARLAAAIAQAAVLRRRLALQPHRLRALTR